jgi:hypothetical protein
VRVARFRGFRFGEGVGRFDHPPAVRRSRWRSRFEAEPTAEKGEAVRDVRLRVALKEERLGVLSPEVDQELGGASDPASETGAGAFPAASYSRWTADA